MTISEEHLAMKLLSSSAFALIGWVALESAAVAADCAGLLSEKFADTEITSAERVTTGTFTGSNFGESTIFPDLPAFCRIVGVIRPTANSQIGFEVWLPDRWNGRYLQSGNGGFAGSIAYAGLAQGVRNGFAVANTDDGHTGRGAKWALNQPDKMIDYGYRAVHLTSVTAKAITHTYYRRQFSYAYFTGCSNGGRESLMEAQRYPDDFDGWIVGAPANNFTSLMAYFLNASQIVSAMKEPLALSQIEALSQAALARCDTADGVKDGLIDEPLRCNFDPGELACKGATDGQCLSQAQVDAVRRIYDDARDAKTQASLTPGLQGTRGAESGAAQWQTWVTGPISGKGLFSTTISQYFSENFWPYMVYGDPQLDFRKLDPLQASEDGRSRTGLLLNSVDPDLSAVRAAGKKIIQYHGWADVPIPAQYSIAYYEAVEKYLGRDNRDFYRLFMVPGMGHCGGGPGPNVFGAAYVPGGPFDPEHDAVAALMRWVEEGYAPEKIIATKYQDDDLKRPILRTRPLCVYPKIAQWTGKGDTDHAQNFVCARK